MSPSQRYLSHQAYLYTLALALLAMGGVSLLDYLLRPRPSPQQLLLLPDCALLALGLGATLLAAILRRRRACLLTGAGVVLLAGYTLLHNLLAGGADAGHALLSGGPRLHNLPALLLALLALALAGSQGPRPRQRLGDLAGAIAIGFGLLGLPGAWPELVQHVPSLAFRVSPLTCLCLILLGLAVPLLNRLQARTLLPPFDRRTLLAGVCAVLLSTASWYLLSQQNINALSGQSQLLLSRLQNATRDALSDRLALLQRMAERWQASGGMPSDAL
ncbi:MAG TPA: hypothetical protein VER09_12385, partial [Pseudomonas sp.]|nr:hypothetical protein [Pseudomonas sp.]